MLLNPYNYYALHKIHRKLNTSKSDDTSYSNGYFQTAKGNSNNWHLYQTLHIETDVRTLSCDFTVKIKHRKNKDTI